ncbi:hypothetical protein [Leptospira mayottensis]|uniref:Uncharacterized protein n=1 Tax=Leptospira mayottensis 200901116 TaxID=1192864 RepID=M6V6J9_9LEPT|nr:hypothetical protein [Leptospira mayottensis]AVH81596.1 hypothetical protein [Leptospira mayottensis 200901116]
MQKKITREAVLGLYDLHNDSEAGKSLDWIANVIADSLEADVDSVRELIIKERFSTR